MNTTTPNKVFGIDDAIMGGIIGGIGSIGGSALSAMQSGRNTDRQIGWERERALNAHQWEIEDLKKAGINPILTATGGSGATTSSISPQMPDYSGIKEAGTRVMEGITSAMGIKTANAQIQKAQSETGLINQQTISESYRQGLITKETALKESENLLRRKDLSWYEADKINNYAKTLIQGIGTAIGLSKVDKLTNKLPNGKDWKLEQARYGEYWK